MLVCYVSSSQNGNAVATSQADPADYAESNANGGYFERNEDAFCEDNGDAGDGDMCIEGR